MRELSILEEAPAGPGGVVRVVVAGPEVSLDLVCDARSLRGHSGPPVHDESCFELVHLVPTDEATVASLGEGSLDVLR